MVKLVELLAYTRPMAPALGALLVFFMRVTDVSVGAIRIVMLVRGRHWIAGFLGFFESLVWVLAAVLVLTNMDSPLRIIAVAAGFAVGPSWAAQSRDGSPWGKACSA